MMNIGKNLEAVAAQLTSQIRQLFTIMLTACETEPHLLWDEF